MTTGISACLTCKHFIDFWRCEAFPEVIPAEIATGLDDHSEPYPGDNGIQFEPKIKESETGKYSKIG